MVGGVCRPISDHGNDFGCRQRARTRLGLARSAAAEQCWASKERRCTAPSAHRRLPLGLGCLGAVSRPGPRFHALSVQPGCTRPRLRSLCPTSAQAVRCALTKRSDRDRLGILVPSPPAVKNWKSLTFSTCLRSCCPKLKHCRHAHAAWATCTDSPCSSAYHNLALAGRDSRASSRTQAFCSCSFPHRGEQRWGSNPNSSARAETLREDENTDPGCFPHPVACRIQDPSHRRSGEGGPGDT